MLVLLVSLLVICAIVSVLIWATSIVPEPFQFVARIVVAIIAVYLLCGLIGWVPGIHTNLGYRLR